MLLNHLTDHPLAMLPSKVTEIANFLIEREDGNKIKIESADLGPEQSNISIDENGIAVIDIFGSISKRMNLLQKASGGVSVDLLRNEMKSALEDDKVKGVLLNVDSPGGSVYGIKDVTDIINSSTKPVVAFTDGLMASAAYWISSGADLIIASETSTVGSIGVVTVHTDISKAEESKGIKRTVLTAGKFKAIGNPNEPLNEDAKAEIQDKLDQFYSIFVKNVAANRNENVEDILKAADGKTFIGANAPKSLIDLTGSIEFAYNQLTELIKEGEKMNIEEIKNSDEFKAEVESAAKNIYEAKLNEAILVERERCASIISIEGGHNELKLEAIKNGSNVDSLYKSLYQAERQVKIDEQNRLSSLTEPVQVNSTPPKKVSEGDLNEFLSKVDEFEKEGMKRSQAFIKARQSDPAGFSAYLAANN